MQLRTPLLPTFLLLSAIAIGLWAYQNWTRLCSQWASYRVGTAQSFNEAQARIAPLETGADCDAKMAQLVGKWGTGNRQFDLYLAEHICDAAATDRLREAFSQRLSRSADLRRRWAHYWSHRTPIPPDEQVQSIVSYLDTLATVDPPRAITWREVLDLRAVFELTGNSRSAPDLSPTNWHQYYRVWFETRPDALPHIPRPQTPLPDVRKTP